MNHQTLLEQVPTTRPIDPAAENGTVPVRRRGRRFGPARRGPRGRDLRFRGPRLRPVASPGAGGYVRPSLGASGARSSSGAQGCRTTSPARWRLTDRGIAAVLVVTLVVAVSALTVVTATAWRVTGENYQVSGRLR